MPEPLVAFSANDGYYRYWKPLTVFDITLIKIGLLVMLLQGRGLSRNTTLTCQTLIGPEQP